MTYQEVVKLFFENSKSQYRHFNDSIINSSVPTIGCTVPFVRSVAKRLKDDVDAVLAFPTHEYHEVDLLKGIVVSSAKLPFESKKDYLLAFAKTIENWAVCDCSTVKVGREREQYFCFFCELAQSDEAFVCRYGLVNLLTSFLCDEKIDSVFDVLSKVHAQGYYVDMAVAWLLATAMAKCRDKTVQFMEQDGRRVVGVFAYNKALQKMRDSFRVSQQDKQWTKSLKRR